MRSSRMIRSVTALALVATQADLARAADFCTDLKAVIAQAKGGFVKIKGAQQGGTTSNGSGWTTTLYASARSLSGASNCYIDVERSPPDETASYACLFPPGPSAVETGDRLANAIIDCIGDNSENSGGFNKQADDIHIKLYGRGFDFIGITGNGNPKRVLLTLYQPP